jgi:hypothetical protein
MPLVKYFVWAGSALLALLFIADAYLPKLPATRDAEAQQPVIRVHSDQNKWPERIVFDTASIPPKPSAGADVIAPPSPTVAVISPRLRGALAELQTSDGGPRVNAKGPEARSQGLHRFVRKHAAKPVLLVAPRSPFGWFGPRVW